MFNHSQTFSYVKKSLKKSFCISSNYSSDQEEFGEMLHFLLDFMYQKTQTRPSATSQPPEPK